jgi:hypothetical protein
MTIEPEVCFNMDLANGRTGARFCYKAAAVLGVDADQFFREQYGLNELTDDRDAEDLDDIVQEWTDKLDAAGYYVKWDAGDVIVWDLRALSDDEREQFYAEQES